MLERKTKDATASSASEEMKYAQGVAGPKGWGAWRSPIHGKGDRNFRHACCDCGLVHEMQFRIKEGNVLFRVRRNKRATAAMRRGARYR